MKCILLAAGYATRLYPITKNYPKPLLKINNVSIIDRLCEDIKKCKQIDEIIVVSNHKFIKDFNDWSDKQKNLYDIRISVLDDGSTDNDNRLGAVKDIAYAIKECNIRDDIIVMAGDNVLDFSMSGFIEYYNKYKTSCVMCYYEPSVDKLKKTGVICIEDDGKIINMQEKPEKPGSNWAVPPFYIYPSGVLECICESVDKEGIKTDAPGEFIEWFCKEHVVYAYKMPGNRYDIGDIESYTYVDDLFKKMRE